MGQRRVLDAAAKTFNEQDGTEKGKMVMTGTNTWTQTTDVTYNYEYIPATDQIKWWHKDKTNKYLLFSRVNEAFSQIPEGCTEQLFSGGYQYCKNYKSGTVSYVSTLNECVAQCTDCEYYTKYANDAPNEFSKDGKGRCILQKAGGCGKLIKYTDKIGYKAKTFYCPGDTSGTKTTPAQTTSEVVTHTVTGELELSFAGMKVADVIND